MISIITINLNNYKGLTNTIKSVLLKNNSLIEFIVIDGLSKDDSISILSLNKKYINKIISEKDNGIYNAMNKGVSLASCNRLLFLNSGDSIIDNPNFEKFISSNTSSDLVYSNVQKINADNSVVNLTFPDILSLDYMICYGLPHQATIINKSLFYKIGLYNENYKIISDWVFFMEALFYHNATYKHVNADVIYFDGSGISNQKKYLRTIIKEQVHYILLRFPHKLILYKTDSPYVKKYFRQVHRWKRFFLKFLFQNFNHI